MPKISSKRPESTQEYKPQVFRTPKFNKYLYWFEILLGIGLGISAVQHYLSHSFGFAIYHGSFSVFILGFTQFFLKPLMIGRIELHHDGLILRKKKTQKIIL